MYQNRLAIFQFLFRAARHLSLVFGYQQVDVLFQVCLSRPQKCVLFVCLQKLGNAGLE